MKRFLISMLISVSVTVACGVDPGGVSSSGEESVGEGGQDEEGTDESGGELELDSIEYILDWEAPVVDELEGAAWQVENDLAYEVRLHEGWTTIYGMSLIPCGGFADVDPGFLSSFLSGGLLRSAWAGDGGVDDPSGAYHRHTEDLALPVELTYDSLDFEAASYCQLHFVYGPANAETPGVPAEPNIIGDSIYLVGSWRPVGSEDWTEFTISASHADGLIMDFSAAQMGTLEERVSFRLTRDWRRAFDGIEFDSISAFDLEVAVLRNLVTSARLSIGTTI